LWFHQPDISPAIIPVNPAAWKQSGKFSVLNPIALPCGAFSSPLPLFHKAKSSAGTYGFASRSSAADRDGLATLGFFVASVRDVAARVTIFCMGGL